MNVITVCIVYISMNIMIMSSILMYTSAYTFAHTYSTCTVYKYVQIVCIVSMNVY